MKWQVKFICDFELALDVWPLTLPAMTVFNIARHILQIAHHLLPIAPDLTDMSYMLCRWSETKQGSTRVHCVKTRNTWRRRKNRWTTLNSQALFVQRSTRMSHIFLIRCWWERKLLRTARIWSATFSWPFYPSLQQLTVYLGTRCLSALVVWQRASKLHVPNLLPLVISTSRDGVDVSPANLVLDTTSSNDPLRKQVMKRPHNVNMLWMWMCLLNNATLWTMLW